MVHTEIWLTPLTLLFSSIQRMRESRLCLKRLEDHQLRLEGPA